eukprot:GHRR01001186.1.p1 GENE.GHRR01001186.1~~GHRR01001186.1.p1  ORF type:complete len:189 (+),score=39.83 GHRR01001186.1:170-736(+)
MQAVRFAPACRSVQPTACSVLAYKARRAVTRPHKTAACRAQLRSTSEPHLQLATARLPKAADPNKFAGAMYQWAATMTQSAANYPFSQTLKADRLPNGFQISLLKRTNSGSFGSAADIVATVEESPKVGQVLIVRFYEGPNAHEGRRSVSSNDGERLDMLLASLIDVDTIMNTMPNAIRSAAAVSTSV